MAVAYGTRINDDTNFITEVDTEKKIAKTRGNIAGDAFISSGGKLELLADTLNASYNQLSDMIENGVIPYYFTNTRMHYLTRLYTESTEEDITYLAWFSAINEPTTIGSVTFYSADDPDANMLTD